MTHWIDRLRMSGMRLGAALLAAALLAAPAHAQLPTLGDGSDMNVATERKLGERVARELYRDPDYIDDPVLDEYVLEIWTRLLAAARTRGELTAELDDRFAWQVLLGKDRIINAFAVPGGWMGVQLGLINVTATRDELAAVLAHELSHVTQRHHSRLMTQQNQQAPWLIGAMILAALAASKNPEAANAMMAGGQAVAMQSQLNFSRDMEREADRVGFGVMTQAGFAPRGLRHHVRKTAAGGAAERQRQLPLPAHPPDDDRAHRRGAVAPATRRAGNSTAGARSRARDDGRPLAGALQPGRGQPSRLCGRGGRRRRRPGAASRAAVRRRAGQFEAARTGGRFAPGREARGRDRGRRARVPACRRCWPPKWRLPAATRRAPCRWWTPRPRAGRK